ncbi:DUF7507 domain-containing protein, partial [Sagittula sp. S175]|uniref:DUF7507 domain-containing protein n=1 Tax=Sagittula sp. S175 TaxID=3415129 RepID=UPI003C7AC59E
METDEVYGLSVAGITATGTIQDNDSLFVVTGISDATEAEGTDLVHVVTLSGATAVAQDFAFALSDITTTAADYGTATFSDGVTLNGSTLTVPIGISSFSVTIVGIDDLVDEENESYDLKIGGQSAVGTITDDDTANLTARKTAVLNDLDALTGASAGDTVTWTIAVTNTGTVPLGPVYISADTMTRLDGTPLALSGASFTPASVATLAMGATISFTADYTLLQADVDGGSLRNTATVVAIAPGGSTLIDVTDDDDDTDGNTEDDPTVFTLTATPGLALVKTAVLNDDDGTPGVSAGDSIDYAFRVVNTGAVTLGGITVTDPLVSVTGGPISLAPGAQDATSFTARYSVTQADIDAGEVQNTATVTADLPGGGTVSDTSGSG